MQVAVLARPMGITLAAATEVSGVIAAAGAKRDLIDTFMALVLVRTIVAAVSRRGKANERAPSTAVAPDGRAEDCLVRRPWRFASISLLMYRALRRFVEAVMRKEQARAASSH